MAKKDKEREPEAQQGAGKEAVPANDGDTVAVPRAQLTEILSRLETLEGENKRLIYSADRGRLDQYDNANKPKELTRVRLNVYEDAASGTYSVIMAWKMVIDEVEYDRSRGYVERQVIQLTLEDGKNVDVQYRDFTIGRKRKQEPAEVISRSKDESTGFEVFKVRRLSDGKEFSVDTRFIN